MAYFCYTCVGLRENCPPGEEPGSCAVAEAEAARYREELKGEKRIYFGSVPGGASKTSALMAHTRKFDRDMHAYREARRNGEQPDMTTEDAVRRNRQRQEIVERAQKQGIM